MSCLTDKRIQWEKNTQEEKDNSVKISSQGILFKNATSFTLCEE